MINWITQVIDWITVVMDWITVVIDWCLVKQRCPGSCWKREICFFVLFYSTDPNSQDQ